MKKIIICSCFVFWAMGLIYSQEKMGSQKIISSKFQFFINGGFLTTPGIQDTLYDHKQRIENANVHGNGSIIQNHPVNIGYSLGFSYFFLKNLGISFRLNYNIKNDVKFDSTFNCSFQVWDKHSWENAHEEWETPGEIRVIPMAISLVYRKQLNQKFSMDFIAGLTVFFTKFNLKSYMGLGGLNVWGGTVYHAYWYHLKLSLKNSETLIGGNIGVNFEYRINRGFGFYTGVSYSLCPKKEYMWQLAQGQDISDIFDIRTVIKPVKIDFSFIRAFIGIKIYIF